MARPSSPPVPDGRKLRGDRTREHVLAPAVALATVKGLNGFSFAELAEASGASKAGIATLFGSKQDLQAAIAERARQTLEERVFQPVRSAPRGVARLVTLGTAWLDYLADPALRGGCFFAAAMFELDAQPGPLRDLVHRDVSGWIGGIQAMIEDAQAMGEIADSVDAGDEAFQFFAIGMTANALIQLGVVDRPAERARRLWARHLDRLRAAPPRPRRRRPSSKAPGATS
ncbi:MAG: TetR family transcriptional regulator [Actinomycetota bacterium]|nr:TetR family transcriptional regulator [Actinomycetota bacterium]